MSVYNDLSRPFRSLEIATTTLSYVERRMEDIESSPSTPISELSSVASNLERIQTLAVLAQKENKKVVKSLRHMEGISLPEYDELSGKVEQFKRLEEGFFGAQERFDELKCKSPMFGTLGKLQALMQTIKIEAPRVEDSRKGSLAERAHNLSSQIKEARDLIEDLRKAKESRKEIGKYKTELNHFEDQLARYQDLIREYYLEEETSSDEEI
jgi:uncharacterized protein Yka (UPF0111/DUF47 family)